MQVLVNGCSVAQTHGDFIAFTSATILVIIINSFQKKKISIENRESTEINLLILSQPLAHALSLEDTEGKKKHLRCNPLKSN